MTHLSPSVILPSSRIDYLSVGRSSCPSQVVVRETSHFSDLLRESINHAVDSPGDFKEEERSNLLAAFERLKVKLESPRDAALRILFAVSQHIKIDN